MEIDEILNTIRTKSDVEDMMSKLDFLKMEIYKKNSNLDKLFFDYFPYPLGQKLTSFFQKKSDNFQNFNADLLSELFDEIKKKLTGLEIVKFTLAFEPKKSTVEKITNWFLINTQKKIILDFEIDKGLIAGAIIHTNGKYKDYSLRKNVGS